MLPARRLQDPQHMQAAGEAGKLIAETPFGASAEGWPPGADEAGRITNRKDDYTMTKTEYMNTINEKLTAAEGLCADLRKLRGLQKLAQSITGSDALVSFEALSKTITAKETELKAVRGELQKARRIVKKMEEIEAIESGAVPAPAHKKQAAKKPAAKKPSKATAAQTPKVSKAADTTAA